MPTGDPTEIREFAREVNVPSPLGMKNQAAFSILIVAVMLGCSVRREQPNADRTLSGTSWQLVRFQGSDDTTLTPDDRAKYTLEFRTDGTLVARIDCNRGRATWNAPGSNELQFGALAMTKMACPPGSLHDRLARDLGYVRTYTMKDGHLHLALMMDGGIYEFEPLPD